MADFCRCLGLRVAVKCRSYSPLTWRVLSIEVVNWDLQGFTWSVTMKKKPISIYIYMCVSCVYTCVISPPNMYIHTGIKTCMVFCVYTFGSEICLWIDIYIYISPLYIYIDTWTYICMFMYIYIYTHINTYIYTHMYMY